VTRKLTLGCSKHYKEIFFSLVKFFYWDNPYLFKYYSDKIFRKCVFDNKIRSVISLCHDQVCGGILMGRKSLPKSFIVACTGLPYSGMPTCYKSCPKCQQFGKISRRGMMLLNPIIIAKTFDVWGIDFVGLFPSYFKNEYLLLTVDYVFKWVKAVLTRTIETRVVVKFFLVKIFSPCMACPRL